MHTRTLTESKYVHRIAFTHTFGIKKKIPPQADTIWKMYNHICPEPKSWLFSFSESNEANTDHPPDQVGFPAHRHMWERGKARYVANTWLLWHHLYMVFHGRGKEKAACIMETWAFSVSYVYSGKERRKILFLLCPPFPLPPALDSLLLWDWFLFLKTSPTVVWGRT